MNNSMQKIVIDGDVAQSVAPKGGHGAPSMIRKSINDGRNILFEVFIYDVVMGPEAFVEPLYELTHANEGDVFKFYIATRGGSVDGASALANAMMNTKAHTHTIAVGPCMSAGAMLLSMGDTVEVYDFADVMYHMSLHSAWGNSVGVLELTTSIIDRMNQFFDFFKAKGLITESELDDIRNAKRNVHVPWAEMQKRASAVKGRRVS